MARLLRYIIVPPTQVTFNVGELAEALGDLRFSVYDRDVSQAARYTLLAAIHQNGLGNLAASARFYRYRMQFDPWHTVAPVVELPWGPQGEVWLFAALERVEIIALTRAALSKIGVVYHNDMNGLIVETQSFSWLRARVDGLLAVLDLRLVELCS